MSRASSKSRRSGETDYTGACLLSTCHDLCIEFSALLSDPDTCSCGHIREFHTPEDHEEAEDGSGAESTVEDGAEDDDVANEFSEDEPDQELSADEADSQPREKQLKARYNITPSKPKPKPSSRPVNKLQQTALKFSGSPSGKKTASKVSKAPTFATKTQKAAVSRAPLKNKSSSTSRKPSGPTAAITRLLGNLYLVNNAMEHVLKAVRPLLFGCQIFANLTSWQDTNTVKAGIRAIRTGRRGH
ncbi:hypothetical protein FRC09_003211 [Ceratobasidium sp. 395]|nr:hypothetical protein FRC09_003211 [Ceratobasidium sp. 395]